MKRVLILLGTLTATAAGTIAHAQTFAENLPPLERRAIAVSDVMRGDAIAGEVGPVDYTLVEERGALPPRAIAALLDDEGFSILSPPIRRGPAYVVAVIDPNGNDGRVTLDAFSGRIIRFRPVMGPNAMILPDDIRDTYARRDLTPPRSIPYVPPRARTSSLPSPAPGPAPRSANRAEPSQPRAAAPPNGTAPRAATRPPMQTATTQGAPPPVTSKPPVTLQPTQDMPPAMGFE
jgi:hypothetical protein